MAPLILNFCSRTVVFSFTSRSLPPPAAKNTSINLGTPEPAWKFGRTEKSAALVGSRAHCLLARSIFTVLIELSLHNSFVWMLIDLDSNLLLRIILSQLKVVSLRFAVSGWFLAGDIRCDIDTVYKSIRADTTVLILPVLKASRNDVLRYRKQVAELCETEWT